MTSKERVKAALGRRAVDRVPIFMWFHPETARRLAALLEIPVNLLPEAMGDDIRQTWVGNNYAMEGITHENPGESHEDFWGITWVKQGAFNQAVHYPLAGANAGEIRAYEFPLNRKEELLAQMEPVCAQAERYFIGVDVSPCVFEMSTRLRGMGNALFDLAGQPEVAEDLLGRCADFAVVLAEAACERFPLDWLWTGDDVGGQQNMLMSPEMWRALIKPHLERVVAVGRARGLPVAYHSCGAIRPIIGDLIEIGIEVLNPIQCNCPGMEPIELKREFGADLAFMGGVDTQGLLPKGSPDEVRRATAALLEAMTADGGGYILAASHTVPPETPDENVFAMYAEAGLSREAIFDAAATLRAAL